MSRTVRHERVRWLRPSVLTILALAAPFAAPAVASAAPMNGSQGVSIAGGIGLRLLDVPLAERDDPRAELYIVDRLAPGTVIHRSIEVANTTTSSVPVVLYAGAATIAKGSFLGAVGRTANDLSSWTSVRPGAVVVRAGGLETATVTIAVPSDAAPGEQYGVIWAEARSAPVAGDGVVQVSRVGIRLYVSVGPGGAPASDLTIGSLVAERSPGGKPMVIARVRNTGGRALDLSGTLQLSGGPGGLSAGPFPATLGTTLAIGDTEPVTFALDRQIPDGPWSARVTIRSGLLQRSAGATIRVPDSGAAAPVTTTPVRSRWFGIAITALIVLLLLGIAALLVVLRHRPRRPGGRLHERRARRPRPGMSPIG